MPSFGEHAPTRSAQRRRERADAIRRGGEGRRRIEVLAAGTA
jgi:hypothetical protein